MRIAIVHGYGLSGSGSTVYVQDFAIALAQLGHEVHLICHEPDQNAAKKLGTWRNSTKRESIHYVRGSVRAHAFTPQVLPIAYRRAELPHGRLVTSLSVAELEDYMAAVSNKLEALHNEAPFDAIYVNHMAQLVLVATRFRARHQVPVSVIVHGTGLYYVIKTVPYLRRLVDRALTAVDSVVVLNDSVQLRTRAAFEQRDIHYVNVPPGVDTTIFRAQSPASVAAANGLISKIGFAGRLILDKGLHCLLLALGVIRKAHPSISLRIAGDGPDKETLLQAVARLDNGDLPGFVDICEASAATRPSGLAELLMAPVRHFASQQARSPTVDYRGLASAIHWAGPLSRQNVAELIRNSDICVSPSLTPEASPLVIPEAYACGVPAVGSDVPGLLDALREFEEAAPQIAGRTVVSGAPERMIDELAAKVLGLIHQPPSPECLDLAVDHVRSMRSWRSCAGQIVRTAFPSKSASASNLNDNQSAASAASQWSKGT